MVWATVGVSAVDLRCHYRMIHGRREMFVSRGQWEGVRRAIYRLDRKTLGEIVPRRGIRVFSDYVHQRPYSGGRDEGRHFDRERFLDSGRDSDFIRGAPGEGAAISTATDGCDEFKWLWLETAFVEQKTRTAGIDGRPEGKRRSRRGSAARHAYDRPRGMRRWEMYGALGSPAKPGGWIEFADDHGHLVISRIFVTFEGD